MKILLITKRTNKDRGRNNFPFQPMYSSFPHASKYSYFVKKHIIYEWTT